MEKIDKPIPHETVQPKLLPPFTEPLDANELVPSHIGTDLSPYHDVLGIQYTRRRLGGTEAVKVDKTKRSSGHVGGEIALLLTKDIRMFWVGC